MLGKILGGRYELLEKIGGGGMAVVYKAKCHLLKRHVAVKILRPELVENEEFLGRFKQESQSVASLSHPNIVSIYDVGQEGDIHYIVMEYICGQNLKEYIREMGHLESAEAVRICIQICSALSHAHRNHIIHRDIKPQNILLNDECNVKVADFGIARAATTATVTIAAANVIGSVHYFSPEQARGGYVDKKSDIYSLGIVLYEMVTGVVPFEGDSAISVALKHIQDTVTPAVEVNPDIPKIIQYIIEKAIEKDLDNRYADAVDMIKDLRHAIAQPDGEYIERITGVEDQNTQVLPPIRIKGEGSASSTDKTEKQRKQKRRTLLLTAAAILFILLLFYGAFRIGLSIYNRNFVPLEVEVPPISNLSEQAAENTLRASGLQMNVRERRNHPDIAEGFVISQNPQSGINVKVDSVIDVVISTGVKTVLVPDVIGKSQRDGEVEMQNYGLRLGEPEHEHSEFPSGFIIGQNIPAKTAVEEDTLVVLIISKGPLDTKVLVGTYTGVSEQVAKTKILEDNLQVGEVREEHHASTPIGVVTRQSPQPGDNVEPNRKIDIWVSLGQRSAQTNILKITLSGTKNNVMLKVLRASDGFVIYEKQHKITDEPILIEVEGIGTIDYDIYVDDVYNKRYTLDFDKERGT